MEIARGIQVPLKADTVASPEIRYSCGEDEITCLIFWLDANVNDETRFAGRITFEGFDAIRCCRGEYMPYEDDWSGDDYSRYPWVFEIDNSSWLRERHEYEFKHYKTPLLAEYVHYLFSFHDEYVELIAQGIWIEKLNYEQDSDSPALHPFDDLPMTLPAEQFSVAGIECEVRHNPLSPEELIARSALCSQRQFQYYMTLDGETSPSYAAFVRTVRGTTITRLRGGLFYSDQMKVDGMGDELRFRGAFAKYVAEVAGRRRQMGK